MSSQAYSFVAVKFKNGVNIEKVKEEMYNNIDMNKWLCVSADVLHLTNYGNTIIYVMSEEDWAKPVYDAFKRYVNNSKKSYHYLISTGTVNVEYGRSATVQLPDEYKGKDCRR